MISFRGTNKYLSFSFINVYKKVLEALINLMAVSNCFSDEFEL